MPMVGITNRSRVCSLLSKIKASDHIRQPSTHSALAPEVVSMCPLSSVRICSHILGPSHLDEDHFSRGLTFFAYRMERFVCPHQLCDPTNYMRVDWSVLPCV